MEWRSLEDGKRRVVHDYVGDRYARWRTDVGHLEGDGGKIAGELEMSQSDVEGKRVGSGSVHPTATNQEGSEPIAADPSPGAALSTDRIKVLLISRPTGPDRNTYYHPIAATVPFACKFLLDAGFEVELVNDLERVKRADPEQGLDYFDVVVFHGRHEQADDHAVGALKRFVEGGKGLVVIHVASASFAPGEPRAPSQEWKDLVGSVFDSRISGHPASAPVQIRLDRPDHPILAGIPLDFVVQEDELYQRMQVSVDGPGERLATGTTPDGKGGTAEEPIAFALQRSRGQVFNMYLGHTVSTHRDWRFQQMITQGVEWVSGRARPQAAARP